MKRTNLIMGMPISVEIANDDSVRAEDAINCVFAYFTAIDERFSTYKDSSEITSINKGNLAVCDSSEEMKIVFALAEETKQETNGYFDIVTPDGTYDPSGLVKGWSIYHAAELLRGLGFDHFCVDAGGDMQIGGKNESDRLWDIGIKNPFNQREIVKVVSLTDCGIATSGTYIRGQHIYNPLNGSRSIGDIVSLTVIGPNVYEADRLATAAFAMGSSGISFIERQRGLEGYSIDAHGKATMTNGFESYVKEPCLTS